MSRLNGLAGWLVAAASVCALFVTSAISGPTNPGNVDGGVYNATPPTLSDGQTGVFQLDTNGQLKVAATATLTNPTVGAAVPATANYVAGNKGGLLTGLTLDGSGYLQVNCVTGCAAGNANGQATMANSAPVVIASNQSAIPVSESGTWNITNVSGTVSLPTGASTAANQTSVIGTLAAGVSATNSFLEGCVYNSTIPALTAGQQAAVQCGTNAGALAAEQSITGTIGSAAVLSNFPVDASGYATANVQFTSIGSGNTVVFEGSNDNFTTTATLNSYTQNSTAAIFPNGAISPSTTAEYTIPIYFKYFRIRVSVFGSGTITAITQLKSAPPSWPIVQNNMTQISGTAADTNSGVKSAGTLRVVLATDQPALTNKLLVTPDSVALPANQSVNVSQMNGVTVTMNSGVTGTGVQRVVLATDQPALTNKLLVTPDSVALPANQSVNVSQINAVTPLMGNGVTGTGSQRVTIASDNTAFSVNGTPTSSATVGGLTLSTLTLAASTNATNVKASAGQLYAISGFNMSSATPVWVSLYNNAGTPTCGTGIVYQFLIPGSTTGAGFVHEFTVPLQFATGIAYCATTGIAGTGNPAATTYVVNFGFK